MAEPPLDLSETALFLDLDGTLARIEAVPDAVTPSASRTSLLAALSTALNGRLAIISGRTLEDIDRIVGGVVKPVAAIHGLMRRNAAGTHFMHASRTQLDAARDALQNFSAMHAGILVEDKEISIAAHYRNAPAAYRDLQEVMHELAPKLGLSIQQGDMVTELRPPGPNKGDALRAFMAEAPFAGAIPLHIGDDLTDEDGFAAASALGGYGVLVGPERLTLARQRLPAVDDVIDWLTRSVEAAQ